MLLLRRARPAASAAAPALARAFRSPTRRRPRHHAEENRLRIDEQWLAARDPVLAARHRALTTANLVMHLSHYVHLRPIQRFWRRKAAALVQAVKNETSLPRLAAAHERAQRYVYRMNASWFGVVPRRAKIGAERTWLTAIHHPMRVTGGLPVDPYAAERAPVDEAEWHAWAAELEELASSVPRVGRGGRGGRVGRDGRDVGLEGGGEGDDEAWAVWEEPPEGREAD